MSVDVAVVGAGIVGCATARELAVRGASVHLLDRGEISGGTTGLGEGNVLCSDKRPGPELELGLRGLELFDELEERLGDEAGITRKGALVVHTEEAGWRAEPQRVERLRAAGVECELLSSEEAREAEPELTAPRCSGLRCSPATCSAHPAPSRGPWPARPRHRARVWKRAAR